MNILRDQKKKLYLCKWDKQYMIEWFTEMFFSESLNFELIYIGE